MTLTDRQKKIAWIVASILLVIHFAPGIWNSARQAWASRDHDARVQKPSPAHIAPAVPSPVAPVPPPPPAPDARFLALAGVWTGTAVMPDRDFCEVRLELRASQDTPVLYTGYSTMTCSPVLPMAGHTFTSKTLPPASSRNWPRCLPSSVARSKTMRSICGFSKALTSSQAAVNPPPSALRRLEAPSSPRSGKKERAREAIS